MQINMEPGGIIDDTMKRLAVHGQTINPDIHRVERYSLACELARQPDKTVDQERLQSIISSDSALGSIACSDLRPTPSRRLYTTISLVGEALGAMPHYDDTQSDALMGRIEILSANSHSLYTGHSSLATFAYMADILSSGRVVLNSFSKDYCGICPDNIDANQAVLELTTQLAMNSLRAQIYPKYNVHKTIDAAYRTDIFHGKHTLNDEQAIALRKHLQTTFPLPTDEQ